jgi:hypothetical protein
MNAQKNRPPLKFRYLISGQAGGGGDDISRHPL